MSGAGSSTQIRTPEPVIYKECLKNHAASLGAHALDGCGEFMPSPAANPSDPRSLVCAACGCHRNFHRQLENNDNFPGSNMTGTLPSLNYQPHHRHTPPPPSPPGFGGGGGGGGGGASSTPRSQSPSPISYSYYPSSSAPHLVSTATTPPVVAVNGSCAGGGQKRFRTRFTQNQKDKMLEFAVKLGWKMQNKDEELIINFCNEIAVERGVFKVWMHNNKNLFGKKDDNNSNRFMQPPSTPKNE